MKRPRRSATFEPSAPTSWASSTVPEVVAANHMGIEVLGISCVTNLASGMSGKKLNHEEVLAVGERARGELVHLLKTVIPLLVA